MVTNVSEMKNILILGAGRSAVALIGYLLQESNANDWEVHVADKEDLLIMQETRKHSRGHSYIFDFSDAGKTEKLIDEADIVISMLPVSFHLHVAKLCVKNRKNLVTASYVSQEIDQLKKDVEDRGLLFVKECGLDPGIDHMTAMSVIDKIRSKKGILRTFETFTGGLLAQDPDINPWQYKFTWNPRNVVIAGQGGVKFLQEGMYKYIPYHKIFRRTEMVHIPGHGYFEGYPNRDSLKYLGLYGLHGIKTMYRGTFRRPGFCRSWDIFVQLGATDDTYLMENVSSMTHRQFINSFLSYNPHDSVELKLAHYLNLDFNSEEMFRLRWLGIFDDVPIGLDKGTPARILEHILKKKWTLTAKDKDMIVMWHKLEYFLDSKLFMVNSYLIAEGEDNHRTAMARTVGLPVGIVAGLILKNKINLKGIHIPVKKEIYEPVLQELKKYGIELKEEGAREIKMPDNTL